MIGERIAGNTSRIETVFREYVFTVVAANSVEGATSIDRPPARFFETIESMVESFERYRHPFKSTQIDSFEIPIGNGSESLLFTVL